MKRNIFVKIRIRGAGYDVHLVTEIPQCPADPFDVYSLPAAGWIPTIGKETNLERLAVGSFSRVGRTNGDALHNSGRRPARTYKTAINNKDLYKSAEVKKVLSPGASTKKGKEEIVYETHDTGSSDA